jgi:hypothetical protein
MISENPLKVFTILIRARTEEEDFHVMYEVIAPDPEQAARFALADMAARDEKAVDVEHVEFAPVRNPLASPGVRFRTGRRY